MKPEWDDQALQAVFQGADAPPGSPEPVDPDHVWLGVTGQLPKEQLLALVDRCAQDPDAALAWRLSMALAADRGVETVRVESPDVVAPAQSESRAANVPFRRYWAPFLLFAASSLLLLLAPPLLRSDVPVSDTLRSADVSLDLGPVAGIEAGQEVVLHWEGAEAGTRFTVTVTDEALSPLFRSDGLKVPRVHIDGRVTASWQPGTVIWRVEGVTPQGRAVTSDVGRFDVR